MKGGWRRQVAGVAVAGLVAGPVWLWPIAHAWIRFPTPVHADLVTALNSTAAARDGLAALDAMGAEVTVTRAAITGIATGPCLRWYARADSHRSGARGTLFPGGTAEFTCLVHLTVDAEPPPGALRAGVRIVYLTDPPPGFVPVGQPLPSDLARPLLARLEGP